MRLSKEQRDEGMAHCRNVWAAAVKLRAEDDSAAQYAGLALDLAEELAAAEKRADDLSKACNKVSADAVRTEKRLKRQVELLGHLVESHEGDAFAWHTELIVASSYHRSKEVRHMGHLSFDQMGDPRDPDVYTTDDLELMAPWWDDAHTEAERRKMEADNADHQDDAARQAWEESR